MRNPNGTLVACQAGNKTSVRQEGDDSDSEIFRIKRRSTLQKDMTSEGNVDSSGAEYQVCTNATGYLVLFSLDLQMETLILAAIPSK